MQIEVGSIVEGKVTGIAAFGAFVELENGKTGLVHISEIASEYVSDIKQHLKEGQKVKVKVIGMDKGKISLSIKQTETESGKREERRGAQKKRSERRAAQNSGPKQPPEEFEFVRKRTGDMSFDDMLQKFKQDSDEKFQDLKRSNEGKRSGGYKRAY
ncbi:S1 RNA-binding domain-containing protein [Ructibacterium gallinarum]|uniref:S1 RNA-binding domain-containing protein n=1 Tax=Ructibacterium gallinarum TaxID=2779355 RepID=A0A9D5R8R0_9FIRM|nr:S1 RNA-binding domain-containing protein [Ructibacterium gallinarum]MBE5040255.1 S1 RNA-binding domain-containing protein [Ructibacterium gallinarum]